MFLAPDNYCEFNIKVNKIGTKLGLLFDAISTDCKVSKNEYRKDKYR